MTQEEMKNLVPRKLEEIEKEQGIRILYAAESGSRAWGTCRESSDFDVRFIFIRPPEDYLKLEEEKDVLEFPIEDGWDMCGWDVRKLLKLLRGSNTQIYEWFASPIVYVDDGFSQRIRPLLEDCFCRKTACLHYLHQADLKNKKLLHTPRHKIKHYMYILQHLGCVNWVLTHGAPPPLDYRQITATLPEELAGDARELLRRKLAAETFTEPDPALDKRIREERSRLMDKAQTLPRKEAVAWEILDRFFLSELAASLAGRW